MLLFCAIPGYACGVIICDFRRLELGIAASIFVLAVLACAACGVSFGYFDEEGLSVAGGPENRFDDLRSRKASARTRRMEITSGFCRA